MKINLIRTGGLAGKKWSSSQEWKFSDEEWDELIHAIEKKELMARRPDATHYALQKENGEEIKVDISSIPSKYQAFFKKLFDDLKPERR